MEQLSENVSKLSSTPANNPQTLQIELSTEVNELKFDESREVLAMVTIKAPFCETPENQRAPLDLVAVLDQSGSMAGDKLDMVKKSMTFAISQLRRDDRLAIVLFESEVQVLFDLRFMDETYKQEATSLVNSITDKNCTALAGGLFEGLDLLLKDQEKPSSSNEERKPITSVLLFTDGQANQGITKLDEIIPQMNQRREKLKRAVNLFCFGFGSDHSVDMLKGLSDSAEGMYYYVENEEKIGSAFGDCIGGLLSVVAQNLELKLETPEGVKLKKILGSYTKNSKTTHDVEVNSTLYQREMGDIYSEEQKNIVCLLEVSKVEQPSEQQSLQVLSCSLKGFDVLKADPFSQTVTCSIIRNQETKLDKEKGQKIDIHRNRLITVQALNNARSLASSGALEQARNVLNQAVDLLKNSSSSQETLTQALLDDLRECLTDMESRSSYEGKGKMKMAMFECSHKEERACHSKATYANSRKMSEKKKYEDVVKK